MPNLPTVNPVRLFGQVEKGKPTYGHVLADVLGKWEFKLYPQLWVNAQLDVAKRGDWKKVKFEEESATIASVPTAPGVYVFTVEGRTDIFSSHSYIFYAGKAEKGLRSRYKDYIQEREGEEPESDRKELTRFLNYFRGWVHFNYVVLPSAELVAMESAIKDNLTPPANTILKLKGRLYNESV